MHPKDQKVWHRHACIAKGKNGVKTETGVLLHDPVTLKLPAEFKKVMSKKEKDSLAKQEEKCQEVYQKIKEFAQKVATDIKEPMQQARVLNLLRADIQNSSLFPKM